MRVPRVLLILPVLVGLAGCSKSLPTSPMLSQEAGSSAAKGRLTVLMTDAPGDFESVNLVIEQVSATTATGSVVVSTEHQEVDLLSLQNGIFTTIGDAELPVDHYTELVLTLGQGSNVVVDGVTHTLKIPSNTVRLVGEFDITADAVMTLQLDFDAARSIKFNGSGKYMMQPMIRMLAAADAGAISGLVLPLGVTAHVDVEQQGAFVAGAVANPDGSFQVSVLSAGAYTVIVRASNGGTRAIDNVVVTGGQITSLGSITMSAPPPPSSPPPPGPTRTPGSMAGGS